MREDKAAITKKLEELINMTREGEVELEYHKDYLVRAWDGVTAIGMYDEAVIIKHEGNIIGVANVSCDSGIALIRDVLRNECFN